MPPMIIIFASVLGSIGTVLGVIIAAQKGLFSFQEDLGRRRHIIDDLDDRVSQIEEHYVKIEELNELKNTVCDIKEKTNQNSNALATLIERTEWMKNRFD